MNDAAPRGNAGVKSSDSWRAVHERGSARLLGIMGWLALRLGRPPVRALVYAIAFYFYCTAPRQRRASKDFLRRALGREPQPRDTWQHILCFALTTLDRLYFLSGRTAGFDVVFEDGDGIMSRATDRGCMLLMSHLGMFDVLRAAARDDQVKVSIVLDRHQGPAITALLERIDPALTKRVIDASRPGPRLVLAVKQAIEEGALVGIMADRVLGGQRTVTCRVLGKNVTLPAGAYLLASTLDVPLVVAFGLYEGGNRYRVHFEYLDCRGAPLERGERAACLAQRYADRLTEFATRYPYNWFNFYDFFDDAPAGD